MSDVSAAPSASTSRTSWSSSPSTATSDFATALQDAESKYLADAVQDGDAEADHDGSSDASGRDRADDYGANERLAAVNSSRAHLADGTAVWNPRDRTMLTGEDAQTDVNHRSWEFEGYLQVRGTFGREVRQVVGDDPWLWELADQSGMRYPAAAVDAVVGQLAEQWAERVGYENPYNDQVRGASVRAQYLRNPSGLAADHHRFSNSAHTTDLPPVSIDRTPGDTTPAPDPTAPPADPADEGSADATPQPADAGSSPSEPGAGQNGDVEVAAAPADGGLTADEPDATIGATGLGVQVGAGVDPAGLQLSELWGEDERDG